jgi:hypothetical protein
MGMPLPVVFDVNDWLQPLAEMVAVCAACQRSCFHRPQVDRRDPSHGQHRPTASMDRPKILSLAIEHRTHRGVRGATPMAEAHEVPAIERFPVDPHCREQKRGIPADGSPASQWHSSGAVSVKAIACTSGATAYCTLQRCCSRHLHDVAGPRWIKPTQTIHGGMAQHAAMSTVRKRRRADLLQPSGCLAPFDWTSAVNPSSNLSARGMKNRNLRVVESFMRTCAIHTSTGSAYAVRGRQDASFTILLMV